MVPILDLHSLRDHDFAIRLLKLLELERAKANREVKRIAEDHELELARFTLRTS